MEDSIYTLRASNVRKSWLLMSTFFLIVLGIGWAVSWFYGSPIILIIAVVIALATNIWAYNSSYKNVLKISGAVEVKREEYFDLYNIVENLAITAGLPKPKVFVINDSAPNAFATGPTPEKSAIVVTKGLMDLLDKNELEGVIAHEMSHIGNRDILVMTIAFALAGLLALIADFFLRSLFFGGGRDHKSPIFIIIGIAGAILVPIAATLIQLSISRKREYLADASGAFLTRYPEGLASALEKINQHAKPMAKASHATAHFFINDPFSLGISKKKPSWFNSMFSTHPPIDKRIEALRKSQ